MNDGRNGTVKQIICIKWGAKFGPEFVNRLHGMIARHITPPFRLFCFPELAAKRSRLRWRLGSDRASRDKAISARQNGAVRHARMVDAIVVVGADAA